MLAIACNSITLNCGGNCLDAKVQATCWPEVDRTCRHPCHFSRCEEEEECAHPTDRSFDYSSRVLQIKHLVATSVLTSWAILYVGPSKCESNHQPEPSQNTALAHRQTPSDASFVIVVQGVLRIQRSALLGIAWDRRHIHNIPSWLLNHRKLYHNSTRSVTAVA